MKRRTMPMAVPPGKAARAAWARAALTWLLSAYVFDETPLADLPAYDRLAFGLRLRDTLAPVAPAWDQVERLGMVVEMQGGIAALEAARVQLRHAISHLQSKLTYTLPPITVQQTLGHVWAGPFVRVQVLGTLSDAVVWASLRLVEEVPASLIRGCGVRACPRIYVASKAQKFCVEHQPEQRRLRQRAAEYAFRERARQTKKKPTRRRKRR
jgi:hypothetical protein